MNEQVKVNEDITVADISSLVNLIDVCSRRGAFEGSELAAVGQLRAKLASYIESTQPQPDASAETEE